MVTFYPIFEEELPSIHLTRSGKTHKTSGIVVLFWYCYSLLNLVLEFFIVCISLFFEISMLGIDHSCNRRRNYLLPRHCLAFTSTENKGKARDTDAQGTARSPEEEGNTGCESEGLAWTLGGLTSPYLALGSHRALAALGAGPTFRQSGSKTFDLLEAMRGISRNHVLFISSYVLKTT